MDSHLIRTTSSSSPLIPNSVVYMEMETMTTANQVCPSGCYSHGGSDSRSRMQISSLPLSMPLVNGTMKTKLTENSSSNQVMIPQLCGIILSLVILNSVIILRDFYSSFRCIMSIFKSFLHIPFWIWNVWAATSAARRPIEKRCSKRNVTKSHHQTENSLCKTNGDDQNLSLLSEVKKVIDETISNLENLAGSADKIAGLFEEEEPSLAEVKEAFDMFDENKDGFIDAKELGKVLHLLGFIEASEEDCKRMIKGFDDNLDGRIDLGEFIKVIERSCC